MTKEKLLVEVARSFSFKLNIGNYQSVDFFCSQKAECPEDEAAAKSEALYDFCRSEVMKSVKKYQRENLPKPGNTQKDVNQWEEHKLEVNLEN